MPYDPKNPNDFSKEENRRAAHYRLWVLLDPQNKPPKLSGKTTLAYYSYNSKPKLEAYKKLMEKAEQLAPHSRKIYLYNNQSDSKEPMMVIKDE